MDKKEEIDFYINEDGNCVFTEYHHLKRGYCCKNGCLHCPWKYKKNNIFDINLNKNRDGVG